MPNTETEQLLLRPKKSVVKRLRDAARTFGYDSGNQAGAEIIEQYLDFWIEVKEAEARALSEQRARVLGKEQAPDERTASRSPRARKTA